MPHSPAPVATLQAATEPGAEGKGCHHGARHGALLRHLPFLRWLFRWPHWTRGTWRLDPPCYGVCSAPGPLCSQLAARWKERTHTRAASVLSGEWPEQGRPLNPCSGASEVWGPRPVRVRAKNTPLAMSPLAGPISLHSWPVDPGPAACQRGLPRTPRAPLVTLTFSQKKGYWR